MTTFDSSIVSRAPWVALCSVFVLGLLGCPAKSICPTCTVTGVMAEGGTRSEAPKSAVNLLLGSNSGGAVKEVRVTLTASDGTSETVTYSGDKVAGVNSSTMTTIADNELYDINGKAPARASVEFVYSSGKTSSDTLTVEPESGATGVR
jgi:hypothetical protein